LGLALPALYLLIGPGPVRSRINRWILVSAPLVLLYVIVGWGREGALFAPLQAFSSAGSNYDPSSLTRQEEIRNLLYTLTQIGNPIFGTGWGVPYIRLQHYWSNYSADWTLVLYTPHNSLLGVAVFSGLVGLIGIWGVIPMASFLAARGYRRSTELVPRAGALVAVGCLVAYTVHCYGDVGFSSFVCNVLFGAALGSAGKVSAWAAALAPTPQLATAPVRGARANPRATPAYRSTGAARSRLTASDVGAHGSRVPPSRLSR
jgi:O-antigen ligase